MRIDTLFERSATQFAARTAVVCGRRHWSYEELHERSSRLARAFVSAGLRRGDRVAICLENGIEAVVSLLAAAKAGGAFLIINPQVRPERLARLLTDSGAATLVTRARSIDALEGRRLRPRLLRTLVVAGDQWPQANPDGARLVSF